MEELGTISLDDEAKSASRFRLSSYAFVRFWQVHAWAGVITSLVVYLMFFLGSLVLFYRPLTIWEEPILQRAAPALPSHQAVLDLVPSLPEEFYLYLPKEGRGLPKIGYYLPDSTDWRMWWIDPERRELVPQRELAAAYLYDLHYLWHNATGFWLQYGAGVLVFGFLLAIVTGVLIHLHNLWRQLYQFRSSSTETASARRVFWSDLHKVTGTFGLPFQLIYALTGTLMALAPLLFDLSLWPVFGGDVNAAVKTAGALVEDLPPLDYGPEIRPISLDHAAARALQAEPRLHIESFVLHGYPRRQGTIDVRGPVEGQPFGEGVVQLSLADGRVLGVETSAGESAVGSLARYIHGLHTIEYGGFGIRCLVFALAIAACVTILSGNWIWLERRRKNQDTFGNQALARLTAGMGGGVPLAVAVLLLSSRVLPLDAAEHGDREALAAAVALLASIVAALASADTLRAWGGLLALTAVVLCIVPIAATVHSSQGLWGAGPADSIVRSVEAGMYLMAGALAAVAWLVLRVRSARRQHA